MSKINVSAKEFGTIAKGAKVELNGIFKSPFVVVNLLEKAAKGDFSKVANCAVLTCENVSKVASVLKGITNNKKAFDLDIFSKDSKGRFCYGYTKTNVSNTDICDVLNGQICFDAKGREIFVNDKNEYIAFNPIPCTILGVFNAFAKYAKVDITTSEKAAKESKKAAKKAAKAAKEMEKAKKAVFAVFGEIANTFDNDTIMLKYKAIKAA